MVAKEEEAEEVKKVDKVEKEVDKAENEVDKADEAAVEDWRLGYNSCTRQWSWPTRWKRRWARWTRW